MDPRLVAWGKTPAQAAPREWLDDRHALARGEFGKQFGQTLRAGADSSSANRSAVHLSHRGQFAHGSGAERFIGAMNFGQTEVALAVRNLVFAAQVEHDRA